MSFYTIGQRHECPSSCRIHPAMTSLVVALVQAALAFVLAVSSTMVRLLRRWL
ncbi:hypothetical protein BDU57DRAFT_520927 [Ampelomyces quisqualis]|uniref:Uncharacterized protein n=1 Tax=Ampelomyces quisqualis TaxID=50730 RepID=A0A6A5QE06_AMPQU|nr:hypothetical protein BDU57DRAFT_520927 [Ampelomyces quisqualis]